MIRERLSNILEASIREFIRTEEPISSGLLYDRYNFGIKPAMIRSELQELTNAGFLDQPYHSAGRVPSDRGYQFFAEMILSQNTEEGSGDKRLDDLFEREAWDDLSQMLSRHLGVLSVVEDFERGEVYKEGLDHLLEKLDWDYPEEIKQAVRDFEQLDERLEKARGIFENMRDVNVFIGRQSPITKSRQLSVIASEYKDGDRDVLILAIGPKWMNYSRAIHALKNL